MRADPIVLGMVSTFPPTRCGIATFAQNLTQAIDTLGQQSVSQLKVSIADEEMGKEAPELYLRKSTLPPDPEVLAVLNQCAAVIVQHEYGLFGGSDGEYVLDLLGALQSRIVVILHTVWTHPTPGQRRVLEEVFLRADAVVALSKSALAALERSYSVDLEKVRYIPHGARPLSFPANRRDSAVPQPLQLLTWGLLRPRKGIETAIEAVALLRSWGVDAQYTVAGETHPRLLQTEGTQYVDTLRSLSAELGLTHSVQFEHRYLSQETLARLLAATDVVALPYSSREQVTSGVLVDALAAGRPVVAGPFPHAREYAASGAVMIVEPADPRGLAEALARYARHPETVEKASRAACREAQRFGWDHVAERFIDVVRALADQRT